MSASFDDRLIDSVAVRRRRLTAALLLGEERIRRPWSSGFGALLGSVFAAALACAACVAISFILHLLSTDTTVRRPATPTPTPSALSQTLPPQETTA